MDTLSPKTILDAYVNAKKSGKKVSEEMWKTLGTPTKEVLARGCRYQAAIWEAAWEAGNGDAKNFSTAAISRPALKKIYEDRVNFVKSYTIDKIKVVLK